MTKKQIAINSACTAFEALCEYRGIPCNVETDLYISPKYTIGEINKLHDRLMEAAKAELTPATDKQMAYIMSLAKEWEDGHLFAGAKLNKYQASCIIGIYKEADALLYSNSMSAKHPDTWKEIDDKINYILSKKTL